MRRLIYCPSESYLEEAEKISKDSHLPINIGESLELSFLDFDRNLVQIVLVPEIDEVVYLDKVKKGFHQIIHFHNDYVEFNKNVYLNFCNKNIYPNIVEKHYVKFAFQCDTIGEHAVCINFNEQKKELNFSVN